VLAFWIWSTVRQATAVGRPQGTLTAGARCARHWLPPLNPCSTRLDSCSAYKKMRRAFGPAARREERILEQSAVGDGFGGWRACMSRRRGGADGYHSCWRRTPPQRSSSLISRHPVCSPLAICHSARHRPFVRWSPASLDSTPHLRHGREGRIGAGPVTFWPLSAQ
jgi:hypothetical protein